MVTRGRVAAALCVVAVVAVGAVLVRSREEPRFRSARGAELSLSEVVRDLAGVRFVFVGEAHDDREHHRVQLAVLRALYEAGAPVALGLEMFRADAQPELDRWTAGTLNRSEFFSLYARNWDPSLWSAYAELFDLARRRSIPMVGLNVPQEVVAQVARDGFSSLSEEQRRRLGTVECNVDPGYRKLLRALLDAEEQAGPPFEHFCEAQLVWDTAMARALLAYAQAHPERTVVVLAGVFHAWRHGIPEQIARRSRLPCRVILPPSHDAVADYRVALRDADYVWQLR